MHQVLADLIPSFLRGLFGKKNMTYIVSANYLDRSDKEHPWLIRKPDQTVEQATRVSSLTATNVRFADSGELENGFGCTIVAAAESVNMDSVPTHPVGQSLRFAGNKFIAKATGERVDSVDTLVLSADGKITNISEGVTPDDGNSEDTKIEVFKRGDHITFSDDDAKAEYGPNDMREGSVLIVLNPDGPDEDGEYCIHYDDGRSRGDTFFVPAEVIKRV